MPNCGRRNILLLAVATGFVVYLTFEYMPPIIFLPFAEASHNYMIQILATSNPTFLNYFAWLGIISIPSCIVLALLAFIFGLIKSSLFDLSAWMLACWFFLLHLSFLLIRAPSEVADLPIWGVRLVVTLVILLAWFIGWFFRGRHVPAKAPEVSSSNA